MTACPREQGSLHRLQQAQHLAEQAQLDTCLDPHDRAADLDLDRRRARTTIRHHRNEIGSVRANLGHRIGNRSELPPPTIELVAMQPVAQRDLARLRARRLALRDDRSLLLIAPASAARRSCQHFHATETVPINWQITWHTIPLPRSNQAGSPHCQPAQRGDRAPLTALRYAGAPRPPAARPPMSVTFLNGRESDI